MITSFAQQWFEEKAYAPQTDVAIGIHLTATSFALP
jgi:hypothetical protein